MGRSPCCSKVGLNRGAWTASEDKILTDYIKLHGEGKWRNLPKKAGLKRCGKSCRLRWLNYLRPDIKRGNISSDEEDMIIRLHKLLGNRWSLIAGRLPGRTDNEIKNYWNTTLGKKVQDNNQTQTYDQKSKKKTSKIEATHKNHSSVVRTKAVRCSKTFFTPQPLSTNIVPLDPKEVPEKSDTEKPAATEPGSPYWDSLLNTEEDKENPSNFLFDINLGEITGSFQDFFSPDFNGVLDFNYYDIMNSNEANETSTSSNSLNEPAPLFSKEMLDHFSSVHGDWLAQ